MVFYTLLTKRMFDGRFDQNISRLSRDLLNKMVEKDPHKRIDAIGALSHPVFDMFLPIFPVFNILKNFVVDEKFGNIEKNENTLKFENMTVKIEVVGALSSDINIFNLSNRTINGAKIQFKYPNCTIVFDLEVDELPRSIFLLTNSELKILNYGLAYTKLIMERLPVMVIEGKGYKFTYLLNKNFIYSTDLFTVKRKKGKCELIDTSNKMFSITKDISSSYSYDKMSFLASKCDSLYSHIYFLFVQGRGKIRNFSRKITTFWNENLIFPLTTTEDRLDVLFDLIINSKELPSMFETDFSIPLSQTTMKCSYVDMSILKKFNYLFIDRVGWCIKNKADFVFLLFDGVQIEIFGYRNVIWFKGREYKINKGVPREIKNKLKICLSFIKRMI